MKHSCDKEIRSDPWAMSGTRKERDKWKCSCGESYVHVCDEANGCYWYLDQSKAAVRKRNFPNARSTPVYKAK